MGSPDFAVPSLQQLVESRHNISLVVTGPDKRRGRRQKPTPTPVKAEAVEAGLPVYETDDVKSQEFHQKLKELAPDLIVIVAFKILPESIIRIPAEGAINLHASLLPEYRGAAPIHHAVMNGETETGCTVFFLNKGIDTGNIIDQQTTPIGPDETTGEVYQRLMHLGGELIGKCVDAIADSNVEVTSQDQKPASQAPKLYKENCRIDFSQPVETVHNFIRGLSPFPGAWTELEGKRANIYRTRIASKDRRSTPGQLTESTGKLMVGCIDGTLEILEIQLEGRKKITGEELLRGMQSLPAKFDT